jgi:hypothetical protein
MNTVQMRGYRNGTILLPESYWWTWDLKKIGLAVDNIGEMLSGEDQSVKGYFSDGLLIRCIKE